MRLQESRGRERLGPGRDALRGLATDAAVGADAMSALGRGDDERDHSPELTILRGALMGALAGTVYG